MAVFTDDFTGTNGDDLAGRTASGGGTWAQAGGTASGAEINGSNQLKGNDTSAGGSGFTLGDTGGADHYAQGSIKDASHTGFPLVVGLLNNGNFSAGLRLAPNIQVWQRDSNTLTQLGGNVSIGTFNAADVWKLERVGTTVTVYRNGTSVMVRTAAVHLTETKAGLVVRGGAEDPLLDDFECGSIGGTDVTVTPGAGAVEVAGQTPTVAADVTVAPAAGTITAAGLVPTVTAGVTATPAAGTIQVAGLVPTVSIAGGTDVTVAPAAGAVTVAGRVPTVTAAVTVSPAPGAIVVAGRVPVVSAGVVVLPTAGAIVVQGRVPVVSTVAAPSGAAPRDPCPEATARVPGALATARGAHTAATPRS